jgi:hypothetical protein
MVRQLEEISSGSVRSFHMRFRGAIVTFGMIGVLAATLFGAGPAAAEPAVDGKERIAAYVTSSPPTEAPDSKAGDRTTQSNCPIISTYGHSGAYICETTRITVVWFDLLTGQIVAADDVVIGTNFNIYTDPGGGWRKLDDGKANQFMPLNQIGLFIVDLNTISVVGTYDGLWCISFNPGVPHLWGAWDQCT